MSVLRWFSRLVLVMLSLGCWIFLLSAEVSPLLAEETSPLNREANSTEEPITFRRVFVPADAPESWPVGAEQFLPIPHGEFTRLIQKDFGQTTGLPQLPLHVRQAVLRAELHGESLLRGVAEWTVVLPDERPRLLSLAPLNLAVESADWLELPAEQAKLGLWKQQAGPMELGVLVKQSGTLSVAWQLAAKRVESGLADFYLEKPVVVSQTLELLLPASHKATLTHGELLRTEIRPRNKQLWVFQLVARKRHRLRIRSQGSLPLQRSLPVISQETSYQLEPAGLQVLTRLRVDARESQVSELRAALDRGLRVIDVLVDEQIVVPDVVDEAGKSVLVISLPESEQPQRVAIRCLAKFRADELWELPKLRFRDVVWTEGTARLLVSPRLELRSLMPAQASLRHIVGIGSEAQQGEVFRLQEWSPESTLEINVGRAASILSVESLAMIDLDRDRGQASIVAKLTTSGNEIFQVHAEIAAGWSVDSVNTIPHAALNEWHVEKKGQFATLYLQLNQPMTKQQAIHLEVKASRSVPGSVLPATVGELRLLRFPLALKHRELLQLSRRDLQEQRLANRLEVGQLSFEQIAQELPIKIRDLAEEDPFGIVLDVSLLNTSEVIELQPQAAQYTTDLQIRIEATSDSIEHAYQLDFQVHSGAVAEVSVETVEDFPESMQWVVLGQRGRVTMELERSVGQDGNKEPATNSTSTYLLRLSTPLTGDFQLRASYSQSIEADQRCNLIRLPGPLDWRGQVSLFGALGDFHVLDRGWTPTVLVADQAAKERLPLLGTYQLGPEEFRRRDTTVGLRLERQLAELPAPKLVAWLAEYHTLQAANGEALHTASYSLENLGAGLAKVMLPVGAELQEAWLDDRQLDLKKNSVDENSYQFRLGSKQRWPYLTLKYSTLGDSLGGSAAIQPKVPECSFPVNLARWTLWAPEQYEIDKTQQDYLAYRNHWWKRVFGPLARARGETLFSPLRGDSWTELWATPLVAQQTKQKAEQLASQIAKRLAAGADLSVGELLRELADENQTGQMLSVDRVALLAKGIQSSSVCGGLTSGLQTRDVPGVRVLPLSGYRLALLVSPGSIVLTTAQRVAHWHDALRPTEASGVFVVSSDDLADRLEKLRDSHSKHLLSIAEWLDFPFVERLPWQHPEGAMLADVGRRAQTVEFVTGRPTLVVRRAHLQRALWYTLVLLTLVLGVWQLGHFPNVMLCIGALAGAACLVVPARWLTIPQAVFLGLVAAAVVRIAMKAAEFKEVRAEAIRKATQTTTLVLLVCLSIDNHCFGQAQPAQETADSVARPVALPRVLVPIDATGHRQGEDVYLPVKLLKQLRSSPQRLPNDNATLVLLSASYRGSLPRSEPTAATSQEQQGLTDPWVLRWKIESFLPNRRLFLPLQRDEADWDASAHRLNGVPVELDWQPDGKGCFVLLPELGVHWLQLVVQPRFAVNKGSAVLQLHLPKLFGATLELGMPTPLEGLRVLGAARATGDEHQYLLAANEILELRWNQQVKNSNDATWDELEQYAWLHVKPAVTQLEVQLVLKGLQANSLLLEMEVSSQLRLVALEENSLLAEVIRPTPNQPTRLQLKLRAGLPANLMIPLRFELQRTDSVGHLFFPRVRLLGKPPVQNQFAVSVAEVFSYEQQVSNELRNVEPESFSAAWNRSTPKTSDVSLARKPLFAYSIGKEPLEWSLRVRPADSSFTVQQSLRVDCFPNEARVEFEAVVEKLAGQRLMHRMQVSDSLQIDSIIIQESAEEATVPLRWSRFSPTEVVVFLGRPLQYTHTLKLQGHVSVTARGDLELPQVRLHGGERGEVQLDLYRLEDVRVRWADVELVPQGTSRPRMSRSNEKVHLGHYAWRSDHLPELSRLIFDKNQQEFEVASVTTVDLGVAGWTAQINSRITVRSGVLSRLRLLVPESFQLPYVLHPERVGVVVDEIIETSQGKEITVLLARPVAVGESVEIQLRGNLSLPADKRLDVPNLQWREASDQKRFVLLPTEIDGQKIGWQRSGLRNQELPKQLQVFAPVTGKPVCFKLAQSQFEAKESSIRGTMSSARIRHVKVSGTLDAEGVLIATAEIIFQPGRATSCAVRLPLNSQLRQLIVGDLPARRELRKDGSWKVSLGPPFMPQRILVSYSTSPQDLKSPIHFASPQIFLGNQMLPMQKVWWHLRGLSSLRLGVPTAGEIVSEIEFVKNSCLHPAYVLEDAMSRALELPEEEGRVWMESWQSIVRQAEQTRQAYQLSGNSNVNVAKPESSAENSDTFLEEGGSNGVAETKQAASLSYPPRLPVSYTTLIEHEERYYLSDLQGQLVVVVSQGVQRNLWRWLAAIALMGGTLIAVMRLRRQPYWHYDLCDWPHRLAFVGGFSWWLLLKPSALGMLVIVLVLVSMLLKQIRLLRQRRSAQLDIPSSLTVNKG